MFINCGVGNKKKSACIWRSVKIAMCLQYKGKQEREKWGGVGGSRAFQSRSHEGVMSALHFAFPLSAAWGAAISITQNQASWAPMLTSCAEYKETPGQKFKDHRSGCLLSASKMILSAYATPVVPAFPVFQEKLKNLDFLKCEIFSFFKVGKPLKNF